ncbi:histidine phosphatase family protein [Catenovulum sediminis]|uniref:phosphoglycerate mutase (2,3-diphosphoglycerate-dependent) n=1 Tax=Catenovulum sediminis TaxID=1740262 RepID=A0ABV1RDR2_9ALTE|nr:histidine phosphatase family protein [Catenovulum sediminis]
MPQTYIALIRHAQYHQRANTPSAFQPYPLTEAGEKQSRQCALALNDFCQQHHSAITQIHSSTLLRAWQTAQLCMNSLAPQFNSANKIIESDALCERSVGSLANLTINEIEDIIKKDPRLQSPIPHWKSDSYYRLPYPGAESLIQAGERVAQYIKQQINSQSTMQKNQLILFFAHGASLRHAAYQLGILKFEQIKQLSMFHAQPVIFHLNDSAPLLPVYGDWKVRSQSSEYRD